MLKILSIQLGLNALTWLLMGRSFGLRRGVTYSWSAAWAILSLVFLQRAFPDWSSSLPCTTDAMVVAAFVLLLWGTCIVTKRAVHPLQLWVSVSAAIFVDGLRHFWSNEVPAVLSLITAGILCWVGIQTVRRLTTAFNAVGHPGLSAFVWLPAFSVAAYFFYRAVLFWMTGDDKLLSFSDQTYIDQAGVILLFASIWSINLAMAGYVAGRLVRRLNQLSDTDQLTKLANRRYLLRQMEMEDARFHRTGRNYAVFIFDLDHFKAVNDTYGHHAGDRLLEAVSFAVLGQIRTNDVLARYGGEEFLLLMPETDLQSAKLLAERIHNCISEVRIAVQNSYVGVTLSGGIALSDLSDENYDAVIKRADDALYTAKMQGRDKIVVHTCVE